VRHLLAVGGVALVLLACSDDGADFSSGCDNAFSQAAAERANEAESRGFDGLEEYRVRVP